MIRFLLFVSMIIAGVVLLYLGMCSGPSPSEPRPLKDFSKYLHLKPGTTVKIVPYMKVTGGNSHAREVIHQAIKKIGTEGKLVSIDRDTVEISEKDAFGRSKFKPAAVTSIEVVEPVKEVVQPTK